MRLDKVYSDESILNRGSQINIDNRRKNLLAKQRKKRGKKKRASQGMTAAIIMIAFIITASGVAFVILTMGSSMQQQLATVGERGTEAASSAMHWL
ncbi:MAG: hypothetical protein ACTSWY_07000 [Promethearchaeota archaeon]